MRMNHKYLRDEKGMSILEVIVAVGFAIVTLGALITLGVVTTRSADNARKRSQAIELAKEGIEATRAIRDNISIFSVDDFAIRNVAASCAWDAWTWSIIGACPWGSVANNGDYVLDTGTNGNWTLEYVAEASLGNFDTNYETACTDDCYYRKVVVTDGPTGDGSDKEIQIIVSWYSRDQEQSVTETAILTDWR